MKSTPVWFGPSDRRLFGWLDVPDDGRARAGVVLCPPLAVEQASTKPTLALLAHRLVDEGYAVVRFDYDGTGDSAGVDDDPARLEAWLASIRAALEFVVSLGCTKTAVVGLRMGALLAAAELRLQGGADAAVLWDACVSGRSFMRQQSVLRKMVDRGAILEDGSVECLGMVLSAETVAELDELDLAGEGKVAEQLLVLTRAGRAVPSRMHAALDGSGVEWQEIEGQADLVDVEPVLVVVPESTIDLIVKWMVGAVDGASAPLAVPDTEWAVVGGTPDGYSIREHVVRLGPDGLFGIETVPGSPTPEATPVLFLNAGVIDHVGPGRSWVVLARELATRGFRSVRFDLSGIGASAARTPSGERATRSIEGLQDVAHAQAAVSPDDPADVVLVGLCSGGYHASEASLSTGARGVVMINPSFRLVPGGDVAEATGPEPGEVRQAIEAPNGWVRRIPARALLWRAARRAPDFVWRAINRVAVDHPSAETLARLADTGTDVLVVCDEYDVWMLQRGGRGVLKPFEREGRLRVVAVPGMDHTLFCRQPRELTTSLVVDHVATRFSPGVPDARLRNRRARAGAQP